MVLVLKQILTDRQLRLLRERWPGRDFVKRRRQTVRLVGDGRGRGIAGFLDLG